MSEQIYKVCQTCKHLDLDAESDPCKSCYLIDAVYEDKSTNKWERGDLYYISLYALYNSDVLTPHQYNRAKNILKHAYKSNWRVLELTLGYPDTIFLVLYHTKHGELNIGIDADSVASIPIGFGFDLI